MPTFTFESLIDRSKIINVTGNRNKLPWVWLKSLGYGRPGDFMMYSLTYVRSIVTYFERKMHDSCPWKHYYSIFGKHNENSCFNSLFSVIYLKKIVTNLGNFTLNKEYRQFLQKQHLTSSSSKDTLGSFSRSDWPRLKMPHNSDNSWIQASQMLEHLNHSFGLFLKCLSFYLHVYVANSYIQQIHVVFF